MPPNKRGQSSKTNQLEKKTKSLPHDQGINHFVPYFLLPFF
jgi:hypothetical protein